MRPSASIGVTPELVARFRSYHTKRPTWGVLHVQLDDGNVQLPYREDSAHTSEERELGRIYNQLSVTQRRKLARQV